MSLTFLAKSSAYSWKMSFDGQVLCQRMLIGPCWACTARRSHGGGGGGAGRHQEFAAGGGLGVRFVTHELSPPRVDFGAALTAALLRIH